MKLPAAAPTADSEQLPEFAVSLAADLVLPPRDLDSLVRLLDAAVRTADEEAREAEVRARTIETALERKADLEAATAALRQLESVMHALACGAGAVYARRNVRGLDPVIPAVF